MFRPQCDDCENNGDSHCPLLLHSFTNASKQAVRLLCICAPAGQEEFFAQVGIAVASRATRAPNLDEAAQSEFINKAQELAPKYRTELLKPSSELPPD